eukprot:TRINITY_DN4184_c0_g1_i2.p1 TRINITY_DN4184_c0_g1~~TRINITY_DN4184_c0_g1_i2.p1  ORF type:complete len:123 (-),score=12.41 TRINITY_DN4184_c0_g1_i2:121-489(-)
MRNLNLGQGMSHQLHCNVRHAFGNSKVMIFISAVTGRLTAISLFFPLSTVRVRYQQQQYTKGANEPKYRNILHIVEKTFRKEGFHGFYKGIKPALLKTVPSQGFFFLFYEMFMEAHGGSPPK